MPKIVHSGDGGDCVAAMVIARHLGGASMALTQGPRPQRPFRGIAEMLLPLLRSQPYIHSANWEDKPIDGTHELINWRAPFYKPNQPLYRSQANYLGIGEMDESPWLKVDPNPRGNGKIIVARTRRYNNNLFPWRKIVAQYKGRLLFVGIDDERHSLERITGVRIEHHRVRNFLEIAQLIAASDCLISNQTCAYWLAAGLGHPLIQESENIRRIHDAQVPRPNAIYCINGQLPNTLPPKMKWTYEPDYEI